MSTALWVYPIRHHGPGSARSLERALARQRPDLILVEGPADGDALLPWFTHPELRPPVALLGYVNDEPARASFWPVASFSPEAVALRWAASAGIPARFMDLPASVTLAAGPEHEDPAPDGDPLRQLAEAAGYTDFERWWETLVEARGDDLEVFEAIHEAMTAVRADAPDAQGQEAQREAYMRQTLRAAQKEGFGNVAVVCGAWHAPALDLTRFRARDDAAQLRGLPKVKVSLTWVPWTHGRLSVRSGYGAGVHSPGYYHHLFTTPQDVTERWFARAAHLLRAEGLDASSASVIEATRLANTLAALRGRRLPGLDELNEAALSVFGWDSDLPLRLIERQLVVGETLGQVPEDTPSVPLVHDLARQHKRLRLKAQPTVQELTLDLRSDLDLSRSELFHRLNLLGIPWAQARSASGRGTFKEAWALAWAPEFSVRLVEASRLGQTVEAAATTHATERAREAATLGELTALLEAVRHAALDGALGPALQALDARAAVSAEVGELLGALGPLARLARYGDVRARGAGDEQAGRLLRTLLTRASVGLPTAACGLGDDAAAALRSEMQEADAAVRLLADEAATREWRAALQALLEHQDSPPLLAGDATRRLRDAEVLPAAEVQRRVGLALAHAQSPQAVTAWLDGFLGQSGGLLVHDPALLGLLHAWLTGLDAPVFQEVLPLLRRVFSRFEKPERRAIGEALRRGGASAQEAAGPFNEARGLRVVPLVTRLLGGS
ncbi:DUF5682 family protein [Deinococcus hohokamensis]|uniref:DUF5682 family protein n=1 Tax=Deinococcus hohokamensis TaxID=309883 RepID=A0ABV9I7Y9_9DEIO